MRSAEANDTKNTGTETFVAQKAGSSKAEKPPSWTDPILVGSTKYKE